jgi:hypothetical protein
MPRDKPEKMVLDNGIFGGMNEFDDTFIRRIDTFIKELQSGSNITASGEDGLAAQEVIEAAIRSHENGTVEDVAPRAPVGYGNTNTRKGPKYVKSRRHRLGWNWQQPLPPIQEQRQSRPRRRMRHQPRTRR